MKPTYRAWAVVLFVAIVMLIVQLTGLREHFNRDFIQQLLLSHLVLGLLLFVLLFALGNVLLIPGIVFLTAAVLALGPLWGGVATLIAGISSCVLTFLLIRWLGGDVLRRLQGRWAQRVFARLDDYPVQSVALLRMLMQTAPALNYALAMSGVRLRAYCLGTLLGLPLPIALYCLLVDVAGHTLKLS